MFEHIHSLPVEQEDLTVQENLETGDEPRSELRSELPAILGSIALGLTTGAALIYALVVRPRMQNWGTIGDEAVSPLPGDEIVGQPNHMWTRGIEIDAPVGAIWPWLVQMGQGRGGLYSYDWLENLIGCDIHNVNEVVPELQGLSVGDEVRLVKPDYPVDLALIVDTLIPESALVLRAKGDPETAFAAGLPYMSWAFVLRPLEGGKSRLLARTRSTYPQTRASLLWNRYGLEPIQFFMERKMLQGIRERVEMTQEARRPLPA